MGYRIPEGRFRLLEWEEMNGGEFHRLYVEDREAGYIRLMCIVEDLDGELSAYVWDNVDGYEAAREFFTAAHSIGQARSWCEEKALALIAGGAGWASDGEGRIDGAAVARGMLAGVVTLADGPGGGVVCRMGGNWFRFDTPDADDLDPASYIAAKGTDYAVERIAEALDGFRGDDWDEYRHYELVLEEAGCLERAGRQAGGDGAWPSRSNGTSTSR